MPIKVYPKPSWFAVWWFNILGRHIQDWRWRRTWKSHPEWMQEWRTKGHSTDWHPGMLRQGKITKRAWERGADIARGIAAKENEDGE